MKHLLLLVSFYLFILTVQAQSTLSGKVVSELSGEPLAGATLTIEGTYLTEITKPNGSFIFANFPKGESVLVVRFLGYSEQKIQVNFATDQNLVVSMVVAPVLSDEIIITSTRATNRSAMAKSEISNKELESLNTGRDIPFLMEGVPSLIATSDAGTGIGYTGIRLRGSDASRINVTINGIPVNDSESQLLYWVNMPDLASSVDNIQVQRGVGTSTNGAGAFGGSVNIQTLSLSDSAFASTSNGIGSFNTIKNNVTVGTGMINNRWSFEGRLSRITSDGYIDRASSDLKSFFVSGGYFGKKDFLKLNIFSGKEITYQSWYGVPEASLDTNRTYNFYTYENQVDNYQQDHYQLFYSRELNKGLQLNTALHYTYGRGYYEEYKEDESFADYSLADVIIGNDTITNTNLVRRKWLDNDFYGMTWSLHYSPESRFDVILGGAWNQYDGDHFGEVIWSEYASNSSPNYRYYENNGFKTDFNIFLKSTMNLTSKLDFFGDLQYRLVSYDFIGYDQNLEPIPQSDELAFFNPKVGFTYTVKPGIYGYVSLSVGNKEPSRDDYTESTSLSRPESERVYDLESGYYWRNHKFMAGFNYYLMIYENQLVLTGQINDVGNYTRTNIKKSFREGVEIEAGWNPIRKLSIKGNVAFSRSEIDDYKEFIDDYDTGGQIVQLYTKTDIAFSPEVTGFLSISFLPYKSLSISLVNKYVGEQYLDNTSNNNRKLDSWITHDLRLDYKLKTKWIKEIVLSGSVNNLLNAEYESNGYTFSYVYGAQPVTENFYYPQAGRNYMLQMTLKF